MKGARNYSELNAENTALANAGNSFGITQVEIDLTDERGRVNPAKEIYVPYSLYIHSEPRPDSGAVVVSVDANATTTPEQMPNAFFLAPGTTRNIPFKKVTIHNDAQPGKKLYLAVSAKVDLTAQVSDLLLLASNENAVEVYNSASAEKFIKTGGRQITRRQQNAQVGQNNIGAGFSDASVEAFNILTYEVNPADNFVINAPRGPDDIAYNKWLTTYGERIVEDFNISSGGYKVVDVTGVLPETNPENYVNNLMKIRASIVASSNDNWDDILSASFYLADEAGHCLNLLKTTQLKHDIKDPAIDNGAVKNRGLYMETPVFRVPLNYPDGNNQDRSKFCIAVDVYKFPGGPTVRLIVDYSFSILTQRDEVVEK